MFLTGNQLLVSINIVFMLSAMLILSKGIMLGIFIVLLKGSFFIFVSVIKCVKYFVLLLQSMGVHERLNQITFRKHQL